MMISDLVDFITNHLYGLVFGCPYEKDNEKCPLKNIRDANENYGDRIDEINKLTEKEKLDLYRKHNNCKD